MWTFFFFFLSFRWVEQMEFCFKVSDVTMKVKGKILVFSLLQKKKKKKKIRLLLIFLTSFFFLLLSFFWFSFHLVSTWWTKEWRYLPPLPRLKSVIFYFYIWYFLFFKRSICLLLCFLVSIYFDLFEIRPDIFSFLPSLFFFLTSNLHMRIVKNVFLLFFFFNIYFCISHLIYI